MSESNPNDALLNELRSPPVRALHRAVRVPDANPPYDTIHARIFYPALFGGTPKERDTGEVPCNPAGAPFPIVIIVGGINIVPDGYGWLARRIASAGFVVVTYSFVTEIMPGVVGLGPGLDLDAVRPGIYGERPSATAVGPILDELARMQESDRTLGGFLALDRVMLGGHSAGGTVALLNAGAFRGVRGVFTYAAHSGVSTVLGYPPNTVLPVRGDVPVLLVGGSDDGVIAASGGRYGQADASADARLRQTFAEALPSGRGTSHLVVVRGGHHFSFVDPVDPTSGRAFLERDATTDPQLRDYIADLFTTFVRRHTGANAAELDERWRGLIADQHPAVALTETK